MSASISKKWIREHVDEISAFGGQIDKENVLKMNTPKGGFQTNLTRRGVDIAETKEKRFFIFVPKIGWGEAWTYPSPDEWWEREMEKELKVEA